LFSRKQYLHFDSESIDNILNTCYTPDMSHMLLLQLSPTPDQNKVLLETMHAFNAAANYVAAIAFTERTASKVTLQQVAYSDLRSRFHLPAQLAIRAISEACEAYKRDRSRMPSFQPERSVLYDGRIMSFKGLMTVSLLTLAGRAQVPFRIIGSWETHIDTQLGRADLRYADGSFTLEVTDAQAWTGEGVSAGMQESVRAKQ
jgi:putative transposase